MSGRAGRPAISLHKDLDRLWGLRGRFPRLMAVNHNIIGLRFIVTSLVFFAVGGILAMLIRAQLATPRSAFVGPEIYSQIFTMHGTVMMFLFAIPLLEGLAMYLLPKMLGARDLAFPRLSAYGYWCYLFGGSILIVAMLLGLAPDAGWFMYVPLSSKPYSPGINSDVWLIGVTFVEISAVCGAVEIIVSILKVRAPGMSLARMPLFAWYMLVTAFMMLVGFPPLILGSILLELERALGLPFFDPKRGGDSLLWQHLFWLFGHPEVYIIFLPAAGVVSTVLPVMARRRILGYGWIVVAIIALAFISFGLWVHHMFTVGIPHLAIGFFSAASLLVAVPTAVQVFAWLGTLMAGRPQLKLPMLYIIGFFAVFVAGGLTGVMLAIIPFDRQAHDTHFVVAHLHYVLVGGFVLPMLAALYYWLPLFTGRAGPTRLGGVGFWLILIGFNAAFLVMHWTGLLGMPRRVHTYDGALGWEWPNLISSIGGFVLALGFAAVLIDVLLRLRHAPRVARNPWGAGTLEWATPVPPPNYNFAAIPHVAGREPLHADGRLPLQLAQGRGYLGFTRNGWLETVGVKLVSGQPDQIVVLPAPSLLPLGAAVSTAAFFCGALFQAYWLALAGAAATLVMFLLWARDSELRGEHGPLPIGKGVELVVHQEAPDSPPRAAMIFALAANASLFSSLLFGALFLWLAAPGWPPALTLESWWLPGASAALALAVATAAAEICASRNLRGAQGREIWLLVSALALIGAAAASGALAARVPQPTGHAYGAASLVLTLYVTLHAALALVLVVHAWWRCRTGSLTPRRTLSLQLVQLWCRYTLASGLLAIGLVCALPAMVDP
jgi:cytochrome c oxidase subunit I+III